jgi:hypothetical protein
MPFSLINRVFIRRIIPTRDKVVYNSPELNPVYKHYSTLKNASYNARYKPPTLFTIGQINQLETMHLATIKTRVGLYVTT